MIGPRGLGMGLAVLVAIGAADDVAAQSLPASLRPCAADHFDPTIYTQALESWGWIAIPPLTRGAQGQDLARAFVGLTTPEGAQFADRLDEARRIWADQVQEGLVFDAQGHSLMLTAGEDDDGARTVRCFATLPQGALAQAFSTAEARAPGQLGDGPLQVFRTRYDDYAPGQTLTVTFTRAAPDSGIDVPDGFATVLAVAEVAGPCDGGTFEATLTALSAEGWTLAETLTEAQTDHLAWTLTIPYLSSDTGGEDLATLLDLQRRAVPGLLRKVDTEATRTRVLTRADGAMTLAQTRDALGQITRSCRIARDAPPPGAGTGFDAPGAPETLIEIVTVLPQEVTK